jgi:hypothetical protein
MYDNFSDVHCYNSWNNEETFTYPMLIVHKSTYFYQGISDWSMLQLDIKGKVSFLILIEILKQFHFLLISKLIVLLIYNVVCFI